MGELYTWIRNLVIYMILNTIIMNLLGNSSYKKYIGIVSGMILVLLVISPLMRFLKIDENLNYYLQSNEFTVEASDFKNDLRRMEEMQSDAVFDEYKNKIKKQVEAFLQVEELSLLDFELTFNRDQNSKGFGEILSMDIKSEPNNKDMKKDRITIDEIEISKVEKNLSEEKKGKKNPPSPMEINIKIKLSDFYNIEPDNINISIQGG